MTTGKTPSADEDYVSKAPEQLLNGPNGEIVFSIRKDLSEEDDFY